VSRAAGATIRTIDDLDRKILALLTDDARRTYDDIGRQIGLSAPAVKRRVDNLRTSGALLGFTTVLDYAAQGYSIEALVHLYYVPGVMREDAAEVLQRRPEVVEAWMITGEADAIARVRTRDATSLERLLLDLKRERVVDRTRSEIVLSKLVEPRTPPNAEA
jgi:Lrp/AsnC family transcriptional regulator, leucine-responsive regulatory protein